MRHKVTQKHFDEFKKAVFKWVELFGLTDWKLLVLQEKLDPDHRIAEFKSDNDARAAVIRISTTWPYLSPPTSENIQRAAIHEVSHMLLNDMYDLSRCRFATRLENDLAEEKAAVRLENALYRISKEVSWLAPSTR